MRYVPKPGCSEWEIFLAEFGGRLTSKDWNGLTKVSEKVKSERVQVGQLAKEDLHKSIWQEQRGLCIYCTQNIPSIPLTRYSHLEHVKPKGSKKNPSPYYHLRFDYNNIAVSCNGFECSTNEDVETRKYCGHYKDNRYKPPAYDDNLFINPHQETNIESFFSYNIEGEISCSEVGMVFGEDRVKYMILHLGLNEQKLVDFRKRTYESLIEQEELDSAAVNDLLLAEEDSLIGFQPMLKQLFGY